MTTPVKKDKETKSDLEKNTLKNFYKVLLIYKANLISCYWSLTDRKKKCVIDGYYEAAITKRSVYRLFLNTNITIPIFRAERTEF